MGVLRRLPLRDLENSLPKCGGWGSPPSEGSGQKNPAVQSRGPVLPREGTRNGDAEGSVSPRLSLGLASEEQPLWLNWGGKEAVGEGGEGITLRSLLVPNR